MEIIRERLKDNKVALFSRSYHALSESKRALLSLIYPLKYSFPNIPVLPRKMCDMLMSPVPFLVGVHAETWEERYGENPDVVGCDLDRGHKETPFFWPLWFATIFLCLFLTEQKSLLAGIMCGYLYGSL